MSSSYGATFFLDGRSDFRGHASVHPSFYIEPDGRYTQGSISLQIDSDLSVDDRLKVAERLAEAAAEWRDSLAEQVDAERTAEAGEES